MYARTEVRLYAELFPMMLARGFESTRLFSRMRLGWVDTRATNRQSEYGSLICWIQLPREVSILECTARQDSPLSFSMPTMFGGSRSPARGAGKMQPYNRA
jgi:hypothetical protein